MLKKKKYAKHMVEDQDPDWGNLKHVEKEEPEPEIPPKEVCTLGIQIRKSKIDLNMVFLI